MPRRLPLILLAAVVSLSLAACGDKQETVTRGVSEAQYVTLGNMPLPYPRALWDYLQQLDYFNSLETYASRFNAFHTQVQTPGGPLVAFSNFVYMSTGIPSVHSTSHAPADIISGAPVQYTVDVVNSGTGVAGPISYTHLADSQPVAGSTTTGTVPMKLSDGAELIPSELSVACA